MTTPNGNKLATLLATWFGCGYAPVAPGTAGSLAGVAIAILLHETAGFGSWQFALLSALGFAPAVWSATQVARGLKLKDPGIVVIDEVLGQWVTLAGAHSMNWKSYVAALVLFRLFDIWKPAPVRQLERLPEGLGIVADDIMAGCYGALVLLVAGWLHLY
jgi:phosphatidylglycerophosphatase A